MSTLFYKTASGEVIGHASGVGNVVLSAGAGAAGTLVLTDGGAGGATLLKLAAVTGTSAVVNLRGAWFGTDVYATLDGAGAVATVEIL